MQPQPVLKCISSMATRQLLAVLSERWTAISGQPVQLESVGGVDAARRIGAGEVFDVAVLAADAMENLAAAGRVGPVSAVAVSDVAIAATAGTCPPTADIAQLLQSLHSARAIGYSTGPSGKALLAMLARWGILAALQPKLVLAPPGVAVGELIARGTVELGFQQRSELIHCPGIVLLGPMPPGAEICTVFSAAACVAGRQAEPAAVFIDYLCSPACADAIRIEGMEPAAAS